MAQVLAVGWTTFVLFLASPQETSLWFSISGVSLSTWSLSSRIALDFSRGVSDLQELK